MLHRVVTLALFAMIAACGRIGYEAVSGADAVGNGGSGGTGSDLGGAESGGWGDGDDAAGDAGSPVGAPDGAQVDASAGGGTGGMAGGAGGADGTVEAAGGGAGGTVDAAGGAGGSAGLDAGGGASGTGGMAGGAGGAGGTADAAGGAAGSADGGGETADVAGSADGSGETADVAGSADGSDETADVAGSADGGDGTAEAAGDAAGNSGDGPEAGETPDGGSCVLAAYGEHAYALCDGPLSWSDAQNDCLTRGMRLVRIDDVEENLWVLSNAFASVDPADNHSAVWRWLGGNDLALHDEWRWSDDTLFWLGGANGSAQNGLYANWAAGHPESGGGASDCAVLQHNTKGLWGGHECANLQPYVCEGY